MGFVGCLPLSRVAGGAVLLLCQRTEGLDAIGAELEPPPAEAERVAAAAAAVADAGALQLCMPPAASRPDEDELLQPMDDSKLRARLRSRSHRLVVDDFLLFVLPTRHATLPEGSLLSWVPAATLISDPPRLSPRLSIFLSKPATRSVLEKLSSKSAARSDLPSSSVEPDANGNALGEFDLSVPRRLAADFFLGGLESASNSELLSALGIRHVLLALPDALVIGSAAAVSDTTHLAQMAQAKAAALAVVALGAEVRIVQHSQVALESGDAVSLLLQVCHWIDEGIETGGVLVAGPLSAPNAPAVWLSTTYLATTLRTRFKEPVPKAFANCRALYPTCRMSSAQAGESSLLVQRWGGEHEKALAEKREKRHFSKQASSTPNAEIGHSWLLPASSIQDRAGSLRNADVQTIPTATSSELSVNGEQLSTDANDTGATVRVPSQSYQHNTVALVTLASPATADISRGNADGRGQAAKLEDGARTADGGEAGLPSSQPRLLSVWYRCRKCRTPIFSDTMLESHQEGKGQSAFKFGRRDARGTAANLGCTSHFLNPDATASLSEIEGKICCPRCSARIGGYHWAGMQCSCGAWVAPAIQVVKSKVDESIIIAGAQAPSREPPHS